MSMCFTRNAVLMRLRKKIKKRVPIIVAGAGTGMSAKCVEKGGADIIAVYNSGRYRMDGLPSVVGMLAYGDANAIVMEMGERHIIPIVKSIPVIAGVNGTDPTRNMKRFLVDIKGIGYSGVINFPTVGVFDGKFRSKLESLGLGYVREMEMLRLANQMGLFTMAYVFNIEEANMMASVGIDAIVAHMGTTIGGSVGIKKELVVDFNEAVKHVQKIFKAVKKINKKIILLVHGGPLSAPTDVARVFACSDAVGFVGASSMERIPVENAIVDITQQFCKIKIKK